MRLCKYSSVEGQTCVSDKEPDAGICYVCCIADVGEHFKRLYKEVSDISLPLSTAGEVLYLLERILNATIRMQILTGKVYPEAISYTKSLHKRIEETKRKYIF